MLAAGGELDLHTTPVLRAAPIHVLARQPPPAHLVKDLTASPSSTASACASRDDPQTTHRSADQAHDPVDQAGGHDGEGAAA